VNPPGHPKARYRTGPVTSGDPQAWLAGATTHPGTWWDHWARWTHPRSGPLRPAPANLGSERHRPLEAAPGLYAKEQ
jgi:poly[(R)-3-hydroxyalkanoate] polymerase subunit PhaC